MIVREVILMDDSEFTVPAEDATAALREAHTIAVVGFTCRQGNCVAHCPPHQIRQIRWAAHYSNIPETLHVRPGPSL
jgi:hypothetical protein